MIGIGPELYRLRLERELLISTDLDGATVRGRAAIASARKELEDEARRQDPSVSWTDQLAAARARHPAPGELRDAYVQEIERARRFTEEKRLDAIPEGRLEVADTPSFARGILPSAAYLPPAPFDIDRTGYFSVTAVDRARPREEQEEHLSLHPRAAISYSAARLAFPGVHLLRLHGIRSGSRLRRLADEAFEGGWMLYAPGVMEEEGFFVDPAVRLMRRREVLLAACRSLVDVALHSAAMSYEETIALMREEAVLERAAAQEEVRRVALHPGRGFAAFNGFERLHALREETRQAMGLRFTLFDFHGALLAGGVLPLDLVRQELPERTGVI